MDLTSNVFVLCTNVNVHLYNYSKWVELSMNILEERVKVRNQSSLPNANDCKTRKDTMNYIKKNIKPKHPPTHTQRVKQQTIKTIIQLK